MEKEYYLGIDGGQSGSRCLVIGADGTVYGMGKAGKIEHVLAPGGRERLSETLREAVEHAVSGENIRFRAAFLGLSGVIAGGRLEQCVRDLAADVIRTERLFVDNDGIIAWAGALSLRSGIIAIAGSGSLALGVDNKGNSQRAGGWGYLFGDEAGAFGIAVSAIKRELWKADAGIFTPDLAELIVSHFGVRELWEVVKGFYAGDFDRAKIAELTPRLAEMAHNRRAEISEVFSEAASMLADQMAMVAKHLEWENNIVEWSPIGGVFRSGNVIMEPLTRRLKEVSSLDFVMTPPEFPPVVGAALLACKLSGAKISQQIFRRLKEHLRSLMD